MVDATRVIFDVQAYADAMSGLDARALEDALGVLVGAHERGSTVFLCGNGGSASSASHFATDLMKGAIPPGARPLRALALGDNPALLTAVANDIEYQEVFAHALRALARSGDVLCVISASGASPNILAALREATRLGLETIALTGFSGGASREMADVCIHVPVDDYGIVETAHSGAAHLLTTALRSHLARFQER